MTARQPLQPKPQQRVMAGRRLAMACSISLALLLPPLTPPIPAARPAQTRRAAAVSSRRKPTARCRRAAGTCMRACSWPRWGCAGGCSTKPTRCSAKSCWSSSGRCVMVVGVAREDGASGAARGRAAPPSTAVLAGLRRVRTHHVAGAGCGQRRTRTNTHHVACIQL